jgi:predicted transcriptional regulator
MTETTKRILDIAERLDPERQRTLLEIAESMAMPRRFFDTMTVYDRGELERSLKEADRGEGVTQEELNARLDAVVASARK